MKVIETNISMEDNEIKDIQSRVVEIEDWNSYVEEIKNGISVDRHDTVGCLHGKTLFNNCVIKNLDYNNHRLFCDVINKYGIKSKKLAYFSST